MPHVLKGHYFPFNLFLREFFSRNVFILCMIRTIHTAVHTIIRQIQWSKHYNSIAVKILFNLFRQCTDFLILLLILTDQKNRCLPMVQTFSFSCFLKNLIDQFHIVLVPFCILQSLHDLLMTDKLFRFHGIYPIHYHTSVSYQNHLKLIFWAYPPVLIFQTLTGPPSCI